MTTLNDSLTAIQKSGKSLAEKKAMCIKLGLRPRDVEYLEFTGFFAGMTLTFGVEIECNVRRDRVEACATPGFNFAYETYNHTDNRSYYKFVTDGSVHGDSPIECVTPVLENTADGFKSLEECCKCLNAAGASVNTTCGLHVHVGVGEYSGEEIVNIYKNYQRLEKLIDRFMAPSRRENNAYYAQGLIGYDFSRCHTASDVSDLMVGRYYKVNPQAYWRHKTVEFRQHQGSTDYKKILNWVNFCCKLVEWSKSNVLDGEVADINAVPFINDEEKRFFAGRIGQFATLNN